MSHSIDLLYAALFDQVQALKDPNTAIDIDRAKTLIDTAQAIVNVAKAETDRIRVTGRPADTGFIPMVAPPPKMVTREGGR